MSRFSKSTLQAFAQAATASAEYLDACDTGASHFRLDPGYYQACGKLLMRIFSLVDAEESFPQLLVRSAAAREIAGAIQIRQRIEADRQAFYPELTGLISRVAA